VRTDDSGSSTPPIPTDRLTAAPGNVLRGMAMGVAEVVPGVSGGPSPSSSVSTSGSSTVRDTS
jgi:hypothetical protein